MSNGPPDHAREWLFLPSKAEFSPRRPRERVQGPRANSANSANRETVQLFHWRTLPSGSRQGARQRRDSRGTDSAQQLQWE